MSAKLFSVALLLLVYSGASVSERPAFEALEYLPSLEYFLQVLQFSSESLERVQFDAVLRAPSSVSKMVDSVREAFKNATSAARTISDVLGQPGAYQVPRVVEALHAIKGSLCETDFHFPMYFENETVADEIDLIKSTLSEQVSSVSVEGKLQKSAVGWDLQLVNGVLTNASSIVMSTIIVLRHIVAVERMKAYMKMLIVPTHLDETVLQDLLDIGQHSRSYNGMYRKAVASGSDMFLRVANEGNEVLLVAQSAPQLPQTLRGAVEAFTAELLDLTQTTLAQLLTTTNEAGSLFAEQFQNTLYTVYGLESSAMAMLRPLPRNMPCVRTFLPTAHVLAGSQLTSLALCNNQASGFLYHPAMQYREQLRQLQQIAFEQLQVAVACNGPDCQAVYTETTRFFAASTASLKNFTPDLDTYRGQLFECITHKSNVALMSIVDLTLSFNQCVRRREAESKLASSD